MRPPDESYESMTAIESGDVLEMVDSSASELLTELNGKRERHRLWPLALLLGIVAIVAVSKSWPVPFLAVAWAAYRDKTTKSAVVLYDLDDMAEKAYSDLHVAFNELAGSARAWRVSASGQAKERKRHAGASE